MLFFVLLAVIAIATAIGIAWGLSTNESLGTYGSAIGGVVALVLLVVFMSVHIVNAGYIGIVTSFGNLVGTTGSGVVTSAPWNSVNAISVQNQIRTYDMTGSNSAVSSDSQDVFLTVLVNFQVDPKYALPLYRTTGGDFVPRILDPNVYQFTKEATAQYAATQFAANREAIRRKIERSLRASVGPQGIIIIGVTIKNVAFTPALTHAIDQTVEAKQQAIREEAKVKIVKAQAKQQIVAARGASIAQKLKNEHLTPLLVQQEAVQQLAHTNKVIIVCSRTCPGILPLGNSAVGGQ